MSDGSDLHNPPGGHSFQAGEVAYLDPALWRQLAETGEQEVFLHAWLVLQTRLIEGVSMGAVALGEPETGPFEIAARLPEGAGSAGELSETLKKVLETGKGVVTRGTAGEGGNGGDSLQMGYPVRVDGSVAGAVVFEMSPKPGAKLQLVMRQVQWGLAWVENWLLRSRASGTDTLHSRVTTALDLVSVTLQEKGFKASANALVTELAARLDCDRVSLGVVHNRIVRVAVISHAAQFKKQMNLVRAIGAAMTESLDQAEPILFPEPASGKGLSVQLAHEELVAQAGGGCVCTVPFIDDSGHGFGALTLERSAERPFTEEDMELVDSLAYLVGPVLEEKRLNDRWFVIRAVDSLKEGLGKIAGPGHLVVKTVCASTLAVVVFLSLASGHYRVTAGTTIEGSIQRAVVAPYDGFLSEAFVRAGDTVKDGQIMCTLDDRDMKLERTRWVSQREQFQRQYREAMAEGNRANVKILREQISQAEAQINLLDEQLARTRMAAPFDGIVITGDLTQALGSPVQRGQVLFEIAPLDDYRLKLRVDEREINQVRLGQGGVLVLNSLPGERLSMTINKITPVSAAEEGRNFFVVEASLDQSAANLRPGMEGFSKVNIEKRKLLWIWTHELYEWVRLWSWSWWP